MMKMVEKPLFLSLAVELSMTGHQHPSLMLEPKGRSETVEVSFGFQTCSSKSSIGVIVFGAR